MSSRRMQGQLSRSLAALTIGAVKKREARRTQLAGMKAGDTLQFVQVEIAGGATAEAIASDLEVRWEHPFFNGIDQSRSQVGTDKPQFSSGVELLSEGLVVVSPYVTRWIVNDSGWQVGANVRVVAHSPGATGIVEFSGDLHLTFAGYAAPSEDETGG